jgi:hypothetical protein
MHKSVSPFDRMLLESYFSLKRAGVVSGAKYMAVQALCRPTLQPRRPAEPFRPHKQRALSAAGPRR